MMDKRLLAEARAVRRLFTMTVIAGAGIGGLIVLQAFLLSRIINRVFLQSESLSDVTGLVLLLAGVIVVRGLVAWGEMAAAKLLAVRVKADLRGRLVDHIRQLGPAYVKGQRSGELVNAVTEGVEALDAFFADYLPGMFNAVTVPLLIVLVVFPVDGWTGFVLLFTAPLIPFMMMLIGRTAGKVARAQYGALSQLSAHFLDVIQGLTTLKLFDRSRRQVDVIRRITDEYRQTTMGVLRVAFLSALVLEILATLSVAIVAVEIGMRLLDGGIGFEQAMFLLVVAPDFYQPLRALGAKFHAGTEGSAAAERIFTILETPLPEAQSLTGQQTMTEPDTPLAMDIQFDSVYFAYDNGDRPALNDVSFAIHPGEQVALVGPSGGGKSTIAALLMRFIQAQQGTIRVDGEALHTLDTRWWREQVAWVPQSPHLFNTSLAENIRLGCPDAPLEAVIDAAKRAGAHEFILAMPQGYETIIGERGTRLSGGQAQRIAIARAFLKDAPLLILDEATSNLDPETEAVIATALQALMANRTVLVIAHRLNTVARADRIVVLEAGTVAQQGDHTTLMAEPGPYRDLVLAFTAETESEGMPL